MESLKTPKDHMLNTNKFNSQKEIGESFDVEKDEKPFSCSKCNITFKARDKLLTHMARHTGVKLYSCMKCQNNFVTKAHVLRHIYRQHGVKPYSCIECKETFRWIAELRSHHKQKHTTDSKERTSDLNVTESSYLSECDGGLTAMELINKSNRNDMTDISVEIFTREHLQVPMNIPCDKMANTSHKQTGIGVSCDVANSDDDIDGTNTISNPDERNKIFSGKHPYACVVCKDSFLTLVELRFHMDHCTIDIRRCEFVKKFEEQNSRLSIDGSFKCLECRKMFTKIEAMQAHKKTHIIPNSRNTSHRQTEIGGSCDLVINVLTADVCKDTSVMANRSQKMSGKKQMMRSTEDTDIVSFACTECKGFFGNVGDMRSHMKKHTKTTENVIRVFENDPIQEPVSVSITEPFKCLECSERFTQFELLQAHKTSHTEHKLNVIDNPIPLEENCKFPNETIGKHSSAYLNGSFNTSACGENLDFLEDATEETSNITESEPNDMFEQTQDQQDNFTNNVCTSESDVKVHYALESDEQHYLCIVCGERYDNLSELNQHVLETHGIVKRQGNHDNKLHLCSICDKSFSQLAKLQNHMRRHTGVRPYSCTLCQKAYFTPYNLKRHMDETHLHIKPYSCKQCGKRFPSEKSIRYHMTTHIDDKPFVCTECGKQFPAEFVLKLHMKTHVKIEKSILCHICGKSFSMMYKLREHMTSHLSAKQYPCSECGKYFRSPFTLKKHMHIHLPRKRNNLCAQCGNAFLHPAHLKKHMLTHTLNKTVIISLVRKSAVRKKRRIQTGRKFACKVCGESFNWKGNLNRHIRKQSCQEPYSSTDFNTDRDSGRC